ncbi:T-cell differentiation antigen CD6-like [Lithobates pipiens]
MATKPLDTFYFHLLWMCAAAGAGLTDFPFLRFDGGDKRCEGVIQHGHGNSWLPLCITYFTQDLVSLICREMKCGPPISDHPIELRPLYNSSTALNVSCPILEDWRNCSVSPIPAAKCDGAAFLYCAEERQLRLSGGGSSCAGRVEVLKDDVWGAVCDDHWDALDAAVACRQLGCGSALAAYGASHFGVGPPQIHLDDVKCLGSERFLWECPSERRHDCTEREHAGVLCTGHREVRLSGGPNNCWGRLEVYMDGVWGTVCDGSWYDDDSDKVCKALGCESFVKNTKYEHTLSTSVTFLCSQSYSLWECKVLTKNPNTCRQAKAVGIVCNRSGDFYDGMTTVTSSSTHLDLTSPLTGSPPVRSDSTHSYFIIVCALLLSLLLMSGLVFTTIIWRLRLKQKSTQQNPSLTRHNEYRDFRASALRPTQPPDDSLQIPILYTGHIPPSPRTRNMEPVPATIPRVPPTAAMDDEEDYGFSSTPPKPLATFQDSFREDVFSAPPPPPPPMTEYPNSEKSGSRGSSSTSSGEHNWYENYRYPGEGAQDLLPPPQSYDGSSEYDDVNSLASV